MTDDPEREDNNKAISVLFEMQLISRLNFIKIIFSSRSMALAKCQSTFQNAMGTLCASISMPHCLNHDEI